MDSPDKDLRAYPRPSVAVDTAVLVVGDRPGQLDVVVHLRRGEHYRDEWALPGTFLHGDDSAAGVRDRETLADAVRRSLRDKTGLEDVEPMQLHVFDRPDRDERGWVLSAAHVALKLRTDMDDVLARRTDVRLQTADDVSALPYGHEEIVRMAVQHVRREHALRPDPFGLLSDSFTLRELHELHEAVAPRPGPGEARPSFDTFRRYMLDNGLVERTGETRPSPAGRPAHLYRRTDGMRDLLGAVGVRPVRRARS